MASDLDSGGGGADYPEAPPPVELAHETPTVVGPKLNAISYLVLGLLVVVWPLSSFIFVDLQTELAGNVTDPALEIYLPTMLVQLLVLLIVAIAVRSERGKAADVGLHKFSVWTIPQAVGFFLLANVILLFLQTVIATEAPESFTQISSLLPNSWYERMLWIGLCGIVAISEEVTFRGYIMSRMTQLARGRIWVGVVLSTIAFASGHLYQGIGGFALIFVYGVMFCLLCLYTGSLYPAIFAHFLQDIMVLFLPDKFR
jgi:membrane protease YdiL (CAAX protease family)